MSTDEEFQNAIKLIISCRGSISCGCQVDEIKADWLYLQCKRYIDDYRKRFMSV